MESTSKSKVVSGLLWSYGERLSGQGISLIVSVVLSRILCPEEYGIIAIVLIFITLCDAFLVGGLGNSLIQKKNSDDIDASTIFYCSMTIAIILYILLYFTAPIISRFYHNDLLIPIIRVLAIRVPISGFNTIQQAIVQKQMAFRKFFFATIIGTIISGILGITMAIYGYGIWALVFQYLSKTIIDTVVLYFQNSWLPKLIFSADRAKVLIQFGWKLLVTNIAYTLEGNCRGLIVGKVFGPSDLAYYDQGNKFPNLIVANINTTISKVLFPALSKEQDDLIVIKQMCRRSIKLGLFVLMPLMIGLIVIAEDFVKVLLTEKWLPCVPFLRILTFVYLLKPLATMCQQALLALGRSNITLKIEIIQSTLSISLLCISVFVLKNVEAIAWSNVIVEIVGIVYLTFSVKRLIGYGYREQILDVMPIVISSTIMGLVIYSCHYLPISSALILIIQSLFSVFIYLTISYFSKSESLLYILKFIKAKM